MKITACLMTLTLMLCGCGPSARQLADQQARQQLRQAVAAVKVCTTGSTYAEFREKRLALEACVAANQSVITNAEAFQHLSAVMAATDELWVEHNSLASHTLSDADMPIATHGHLWQALLVVNPAVAAKKNCSDYQRQIDPDFHATHGVKLGLTLIADQCEDLLK